MLRLSSIARVLCEKMRNQRSAGFRGNTIIPALTALPSPRGAQRRIAAPAAAIPCLIWVASVAMHISATAWSNPIPPDDMFFAPSSMVPGIYPEQPMTGDMVTQPMTAVWTENDILAIDPDRVDITITGVEILPVLVPNQASHSEEGEYTDADLAAINVNNYSTYFKQVAGTNIMDSATDYTASLSANVLTVQFGAPAVYVVRVKTTSSPAPGDPLETVEYLFGQFVNDFLADDGPPSPIDVHRAYELPTSLPLAGKRLYVVSSNDPNDNGFNANAREYLEKAGQNVATASTIQQAIDAIQQFSQNQGRKVPVTLVGHGRSGSIKIGTERINKQADSNMSGSAFGNAIAAFVDDLTFFSCNVAQGNTGTAFLQNVANGIGGSAGAWPTTVTAAGNTNLFGIKIRDGYFNVDGRGKKGSETVPPPSCPTDIAPRGGDGMVDVCDLQTLLAAWGPCTDPTDCPADFNEDGVADVSDLLTLLANWGPCPDVPGSNCCDPHTGAGCDDLICAKIVCSMDFFCCEVAWDSACAALANDVCEVCIDSFSGGCSP